MTNLKVKQISSKLVELYEKFLDLSDISKTDKDREPKVLTRCLAAHAVQMSASCSEKDAAAAVWDGADDNGLDAVYHSISDKRIIVVQSKWIGAGSGEPDSGDIAKFANGVRDLVEQNTANFAQRLQTRMVDIGPAILSPGTTVEIVLISTGASTLAKHGTANLDRVLNELNGSESEDPIAVKVVRGLTEVYDSLARSGAADKISITANISEWSVVSQPYLAYFGIIDGLQLKEWWTINGKRLLEKNIRHALGATEVNDGIRGTATQSPEHFWYFNNGITLIADEALKSPKAAASRSSGTFEFKGVSIVNGAQTVSSLARIALDESLGKVRVPIRVIVLKEAPETFGGEVTRTNNLQNRIEGRDFVAHDPEQLRLQKEMSMEGVDYQFLRSEDAAGSAKSCELIEVSTTLACAAGDPNLAVQVKTGIGRFFNDLKRAPYKSIFNPAQTGARAFNATIVLREIEKWIDNKKDAIGKRSGYSWGTLVHGNRIIASATFKRLGENHLKIPIADFRTAIGNLPISTECEHVYNSMVGTLNSQFPGKFLAVLFKSPAMSKVIFDAAVQ